MQEERDRNAEDWFVDTGSYPTRSGNRVAPLVDGMVAFRRVCEAIEAAEKSVCSTIAILHPSFQMPDGRGTVFDVLEQAALRGVDVRILFWRPHYDKHKNNVFWGSGEHFALLHGQAPHINVRWDLAAPDYCQHQKSWVIDAGEDDAIAIVGGINLNPSSVVLPGHAPIDGVKEPQHHDVYVELNGPAVADVQHNFVQRWNEASERAAAKGRVGPAAATALEFPAAVPGVPAGNSVVQIQRTTRRGLYTHGHAAVGSSAFDIERGERTNLDQYLAAIGKARRTIYMENQYIEVEPIVTALHDALARGVEVLIVLPVMPDYTLREQDLTEKRKAFLGQRAALSAHPGFMLCGLAVADPAGGRRPVYVHSKLMIVDGEFAVVGSCNLHHYSLFGNGELNAAVHDQEFATGLLAELFDEHIAEDTRGLTDLESLRTFKRVAERNRARLESGESGWNGLAFRMEFAMYGELDPLAKSG